MEILAHRGCWNKETPANSLNALEISLKNGFGFESDIRDYKEELVISHNMAVADAPSAKQVFQMLREFQNQYCFAINVKADGMAASLADMLLKNNICNYFTFDMSVPQMLEYREAGLAFFTRQSEYEASPILYNDAAGVWLDAFDDNTWITEQLILNHLHKGKKVCIVSPDLHHREYLPFWEFLRKLAENEPRLMLCTDHPAEARDFFLAERMTT